jgi:DNA polymerase IV
MSAPRIILCLDLDAFYASVEELLHPEWRGQPILVGGRPEERGVVSSCSYAARAFGVRSAMPMGQALQRCPHAIVTASRHELYSDYSHRVMTVICEYGCPMEQVSVDEVFLDATDCAASWLPEGGAPALAADIQRRILEEIGLPCTIGIASNKLVAKIACIQGKPNGLLQVPAGDEASFLAPLPISKLWGVGPKGTTRLEARGIRTIGDLQNAPFETLKLEFGSWALDLQRKAYGRDSSLVETEHEIKSISRETTFVKDVGDLAQLKHILLSLSEDVGRDLRSEGLLAKTIAIKLRWPSFQTITRQTTLTRPTDSTAEIYQAAAFLLTAAMKRGAKVRLLGVRVTNLAGGRQLDFFDTSSEKRVRLEKAVDSIRDRFGEKAIRRAALIRKRGTRLES